MCLRLVAKLLMNKYIPRVAHGWAPRVTYDKSYEKIVVPQIAPKRINCISIAFIFSNIHSCSTKVFPRSM